MAHTLLNVERAECLQLGQLGRVLTLAAFFQPLTLECRHWHNFFFGWISLLRSVHGGRSFGSSGTGHFSTTLLVGGGFFHVRPG